MSDIAKISNGLTVFIPAESADLSARKFELEMMTDYDPDIYPELWDALAADYEAVYGYESILADKCRRKAQYYREQR